MKKILATFCALAVFVALAVPMAKADYFYSEANAWWYNADVAGTLTFKDNHNTRTFEVVPGDNFLGLQRNFNGQLVFVSFEPAVTWCTVVFTGVQYASGFWADFNQSIGSGGTGYIAFPEAYIVPFPVAYDGPLDQIDWENVEDFYFANGYGFEDIQGWAAATCFGVFYADDIVDIECLLSDYADLNLPWPIWLVGIIADPVVAPDPPTVGWCENCEGSNSNEQCGGAGCDGGIGQDDDDQGGGGNQGGNEQ